MSFWEGFGASFEVFWSVVTAAPELNGMIVSLFAATLLITVIKNTVRHRKLKRSGILEVDQMTGRKFEEYLQVLFREQGYSVQLTPATGDYGADLILTGKNKKIIVQAKRYKKNVGIKAVQEISSAKNHFQADESWVVTNSHYTEPAKKLAKSNQVRLVDRELLMKWMLEMKKDGASEQGAVSAKIE